MDKSVGNLDRNNQGIFMGVVHLTRIDLSKATSSGCGVQPIEVLEPVVCTTV